MNNSKFSFWLWFGLILTISPLLFTFWKLRGINHLNESYSQTLIKVTEKGELLLVCLSLLGANLGELIREETEWIQSKFTLLGCTFVLCLFAIYSFADINTSTDMNPDYVLTTSIAVFISSLILCLSTHLLPKNLR